MQFVIDFKSSNIKLRAIYLFSVDMECNFKMSSSRISERVKKENR